METTRRQLRQIIKEEFVRLNEDANKELAQGLQKIFIKARSLLNDDIVSSDIEVPKGSYNVKVSLDLQKKDLPHTLTSKNNDIKIAYGKYLDEVLVHLRDKYAPVGRGFTDEEIEGYKASLDAASKLGWPDFTINVPIDVQIPDQEFDFDF